MSPRSSIIASKSVIVVQVQDLTNSAFTTIEKRLKLFSNRISAAGLELFSGGLFGSLGTKFLLNEFQNLEDALLFLKTKLQPTEKEFQQMEETIRNLGRTTSFTTQKVTEAATILAQAGFKASEVQDLLLPTLDLAKGSQVELSEAGAILANTLRSFSLEASKAGEVASQFSAAARLGTIDVTDLKESIKEVLGTARVLNIDLPTTLGLITQLSERSLKGTKAGTSLNTALLNLASKGNQLKKLGISLPDNLNGGEFIKFLKELKANIAGLGNRQQVAILQRLFNIRGARAITALDDIDKVISLTEEIRNAGDEARKTAQIMDSGYGGSIRRATASTLSLGLAIGGVLGKGIEPLLNKIPPLAGAFEKLALANERLTFSLGIAPPLILAAGAGALIAGFALNKLAKTIGGLGSLVRVVGTGIGTVLNKNLLGFAILVDRSKKQLKGLDQGLAKTFLPAVLQGGRGRNANKPKKTSFVGRVGNAPLSFTQGLKSLTTGAGSGLTAIFSGFKKLQTIVISLTTAFSKLPSKLAPIKLFFTSIGAVVGRVITQLRSLNTILLSASGTAIKGSALGIIIQGIKDIDNILGTAANGIMKGFFSILGKGLTGLAKGASTFAGSGFKLLLSSLRALTKVDYIKALYNILTTGLKLTGAFLRAGFAVGRFIFSFNGLFLIAELLLIFGPKIEFIRKAFARLGKGFVDAFGSIKSIFTDIVPVFELFRIGFARLVKGDSGGIDNFAKGLSLIADIVSTRLSQAWNHLVVAIAPAYDFMLKMISSTIELGKLFASLFGATVGTGLSGIGKAIEAGIGGQGSIGDLLKSIFSQENFEALFITIGSFLTGLANTIVPIIRFMAESVIGTMIQVQYAIIGALRVLGSLEKFFTGTDSTGAEQEKLRGSAFRMSKALDKFGKEMDKIPNTIQTAFEDFSKRIKEIFGKDALKDAENNQAALANQVDQNKQNVQNAVRDARRKVPKVGPDNTPNNNPILTGSLPGQGLSQRDKVLRGFQNRRDFIQGQLLGINLRMREVAEQRKLLREGGFKDVENTTRNKDFMADLETRKKLNNELKELTKQENLFKRFGNGFNIPVNTLADVAATSIGSFQATRGDKFGMGTGDIQQQQLGALQEIVDNTGGAMDSLEQLNNAKIPFLVQ